MIRIDLGKEDITGGKAKKSFLGGLELPAGFPTIQTIQSNLRATITLGASVALTALLPLFLGQYKSFVITQNQEKIKSLNAKIDALNQEVTRYKPFQKELESYEQQKKIIADRLSVVRLLLEARNTPVSVLDAVGQSLPQRTWVSQVEFTLASDKAALLLQGRAYSNEDISDYVDKLSESVYLGDVTLEEVNSASGPNQMELKGFTISAKPKVKSVPGMAPFSAPSQPPPPAAAAAAPPPATAANNAAGQRPPASTTPEPKK